MDLTEAVHAQTLIDWLTNPHATTAAECDAARDAAAWLADRAHPVLKAGPTSAQVLLAWPDLLEGCPGCPTCTPDIKDHHDDQADVDVDDQVDDRAGRSRGGELSEDDVRELVAQGWLAPVPPTPAPDPAGVVASGVRA